MGKLESMPPSTNVICEADTVGQQGAFSDTLLLKKSCFDEITLRRNCLSMGRSV